MSFWKKIKKAAANLDPTSRTSAVGKLESKVARLPMGGYLVAGLTGGTALLQKDVQKAAIRDAGIAAAGVAAYAGGSALLAGRGLSLAGAEAKRTPLPSTSAGELAAIEAAAAAAAPPSRLEGGQRPALASFGPGDVHPAVWLAGAGVVGLIVWAASRR